jgi:hypothetical protein
VVTGTIERVHGKGELTKRAELAIKDRARRGHQQIRLGELYAHRLKLTMRVLYYVVAHGSTSPHSSQAVQTLSSKSPQPAAFASTARCDARQYLGRGCS